MRELKFRMYAREKKSGNSGVSPSFEILDIFENDDYFNRGDYDILHVQQYTGLKDKNGKEIYEGDIVKKLGLVAFIVDWTYYQSQLEGTPDNHEVIGNIYENPELIGQKKKKSV